MEFHVRHKQVIGAAAPSLHSTTQRPQQHLTQQDKIQNIDLLPPSAQSPMLAACQLMPAAGCSTKRILRAPTTAWPTGCFRFK